MNTTKKPITWADLRRIANDVPPERLDDEVIWWGEERGGEVYSAEPLEEDYIDTDYGFEAKSAFNEEELKELEGNQEMPKGRMILWVEPTE